MTRKILIMGLPGAGKSTIAQAIAPRLNAVVFNGDEIRHNLNKDLGFDPADRIEQARRIGWLCDQVVKAGGYAIADFICPTPGARSAFMEAGTAYIVWVDRIKRSRFEDTNRIFVPPQGVNLIVEPEGSPEYWAEKIILAVRPIFDPQKPTALFVGRYQPFHDGHKALIEEGLRRVGQVCLAVRDTTGLNEKNPFRFDYIRARIEHALREFEGRFIIVPFPNITHIFYGRDVGYTVEKLTLDASIESLSGTQEREKIAGAAEP
jgi:cytidyltransferase-like protein